MGLSITIFGVSLENLSKTQVLAKFESCLNDINQHLIVTPNPEMLLLARKNSKFKDILNGAGIKLIDGFGLLFISRLLYGLKLSRYTGVDAVQDIIKLAVEKEKKVFLLGSNEKVLESLIARWSKKFPSLQIMGYVGPRLKFNKNTERGFTIDETIEKETLNLIQQQLPDIVLVGFGHGKQELWINSVLKKMPSVRLAMGVGGSFDYLSGVVPRAPQWMQSIGLEWLYRLAEEPWRIKRILRAVIVFPLYAILEKILYERKS